MASFHAFSLKKRWFFTIKWAVSSARNADISLKNRRFLKMIRMFVFSKKVYCADYQYFVCNAKNRRFSASNDNTLANIGCIHGQNSLFVDFFHCLYEAPRKIRKKPGVRCRRHKTNTV